ncbi:RNA 2',3'-cyclic phosphodiesterase [Sorangium sp. So ce887]|uniref:RNA 2',3'-cyclic phosphodiesterase n=1 Tax=Sorangium sp. So ce887 TaxID=3133324 RepID=UPI003F5FBCF4
MRVFVAVDPGAELLAKVGELLREISPRAPSAKWVEPAGLHITLAFMGEIGEERLPLVIAAAGSVAAFHRPLRLSIEKGGAFGTRRRPRVLWLGVGGAVGALTAIHRDLEQTLSMSTGYVPEDRPFAPHLTLARSRDPRGDPALDSCAQAVGNVDFGETRIEEIIVYQSEMTPKGARYTALARVPLEGIGAPEQGR